jgi:hypothetical protein
MTMTDTPSDPKSAGSDAQPVAGGQAIPAVTFEDQVQSFWKKNSTLVIGFCIAVAVGIAGFGVWEYLARQKEQDVQNEFSAAKTPEAQKAFAAKHPDHVLAAVVHLQSADEAFAAGKIAEAQAGYEKVGPLLKDGPVAARIKLALAMCKILGGKATEGTAELKQLAEDASQLKGVRLEATYHLESMAVEAGVVADAQKYSDLLMQIDPTGSSPWTQRGLALRATLPAPALPAPAAEATSDAPPAIQFKPVGK